MENWKKCHFNFQKCLHPNQDCSETVKDISSEKVRHLENSVLHNPLVLKLAPLPQGGHKKIRRKMCETFARHCTCVRGKHYFNYFHFFTTCVRGNTIFTIFAILLLLREAIPFSLFYYSGQRQHYFNRVWQING